MNKISENSTLQSRSVADDQTISDQARLQAKKDERLSSGWRSTTVDESIKIIDYRGRTPPFDGDIIPHLRSQNVKSGRIVWEDVVHISEHTYNMFMTRGIPQSGDLLFTTEAPLGEVAPVPDQRFSVAQRIMILRPAPEIWFSPFLMYQLMSSEVQDRIRSKGTGSTVTGVSSRNFKPVVLSVAPSNEQRRIVSEIEKQFTRLDVGVAALKRVQANLKRYRAAVLKAACEGKLVPTEAELHKSAGKSKKDFESGEQLLKRVLDKRRKNWTGRRKYKEPVSPETTNLPRIPEGWTWASAEQLTDENRSITYGVIKLGVPVQNGVHILRSSDVRHLRLDLKNVKRVSPDIAGEYRRTFLKGGEVLITVRGTLGGVVVAPVECAGFNISREVAMLAMVEPAIAKITAMFIGSAPLQRWLLQRAKGIAYTGINIETLKELPIPLPPPAEQTRIVAEVERRLSAIEELEAVVSVNLQRATRLRQSILQKAFAGKLVLQESAATLSKLIELPKPKRPNIHFARAVLSAEIVHQLHGESTLGRVKHQKIFHLCEHIAQMEEIQGQYHREAAGPLDNKLIYANEAELKRQKWYATVNRDSMGHAYEPLDKAGGHRKYLEGYWPDKLPLIGKLINLMRTWSTERCEIFCTTYAAWNDLIMWGKEPTEAAILHEILECWHKNKKLISEKRWSAAIAWMKKEGYSPTGFGKSTMKQP